MGLQYISCQIILYSLIYVYSISLQLFNGNTNNCAVMVSSLIKMENKANLELFTNKICSLNDKDIHKIIMDLMQEINFSKYIKMVSSKLL